MDTSTPINNNLQSFAHLLGRYILNAYNTAGSIRGTRKHLGTQPMWSQPPPSSRSSEKANPKPVYEFQGNDKLVSAVKETHTILRERWLDQISTLASGKTPLRIGSACITPRGVTVRQVARKRLARGKSSRWKQA